MFNLMEKAKFFASRTVYDDKSYKLYSERRNIVSGGSIKFHRHLFSTSFIDSLNSLFNKKR